MNNDMVGKERRPVAVFEVVRWNDGTFDFNWRNLINGSPGMCHIRFESASELVKEIEMTFETWCRHSEPLRIREVGGE
jgi:hypothetical protein